MNYELLLLISMGVLLFVIISEIFEWIYSLSIIYEYTYDNDDKEKGPSSWKHMFQSANGRMQSPINLSFKKDPVIVENQLQLVWSRHYSELPLRMDLYNDKYCVILKVTYKDLRPFIRGGPLKKIFQLQEIRFRWGPNDYEGTEHMINHKRYALELQAFHICPECSGVALEKNAEKGHLLIISFMYRVVEMENPCFDALARGLKYIKNQSYYQIDPFPLASIMPPFGRNYYTYFGSLTFPPCTEGVRWIVQPEPLWISSDQVRCFRKVCGRNNTPIITNTRPVQLTNKRDVAFYK